MSPTAKKRSAPAKAKPAKTAAKPQPKAKAGKTASAAKAGAAVNVLVWLKAKKGKDEPLARALKTLAGRSRAESGCQVFDLHPSAAEPGNFFLHEVWTSEADLANHRLTPHFQYWVGLQPAILESRRRYLAE